MHMVNVIVLRDATLKFCVLNFCKLFVCHHLNLLTRTAKQVRGGFESRWIA